MGDDQPADMLRQVAGEAEQLPDQPEQLPGEPALGIEARFAQAAGEIVFAHPAMMVHPLRQPIDAVGR